MTSPLKLIRLLADAHKAESIMKGKATPMQKASQIVALLVQLVGTLGLATAATTWTDHHLMLVVGINLALTVGHALLPSVIPGPIAPQPQIPPSTGAKVGMILLALLLLPAGVHAQQQDGQTLTPQPLQNFYAGGVSYSINATPSIAGTGLYAHAVGDSGTYAFTAIDALPNTITPFTVSTNVGVGVAQQLFTLGKVPVFMPTAAGISWSGNNTGWQWNGGVFAPIKVKGSYYLAPSVRFLKSSVSGGSGYQPIIGLLFGWGK